MNRWYLLSLVGQDRPSIVAQLSAALCQGGCNLGVSSMARLGESFTIMVMVESALDESAFEELVRPIAQRLELKFHLDPVAGGQENHVPPDVRISVYADDRPGIVEDLTRALADSGLNISHLDSNIGESQGENPTYYVHIEGTVARGLDPIYEALDRLSDEKNMTIQLIPINIDHT